MTFSIARAGDRGMLVRFEEIDPDELASLARRAAARPEIESAIPGWSSLLAVFRGGMPAERQEAVLGAILRDDRDADLEPPQALHEIPVSFEESDAPDLGVLLGSAGLTRDAFLERIARVEFRARFLGFRPGFAYLEGLPSDWILPRRETPRRSVPAGSFAIAGEKAAFYPAESPGGWNLVGRADAPFWDPDRDPPNLISPGDRVRIVPAASLEVGPPRASVRKAPVGEVLVTVLHPGTAIFLVGGRDPSRNRWGLPASGPFDAEAAARANRNVGNEDDAPVLECALSGPRLLWNADAMVSWAGAGVSLRIEGSEMEDPRVIRIRLGEILEIGALRPGARGYLAVRGGFAPPPHRDLPPRLEGGEVLAAGDGRPGPGRISELTRRSPGRIRALPGPDPVPEPWLRILRERDWTVTPESDRAAVRFRSGGAAPELPRELPSAGMQCGTVQWHPDGDLVAMGPDHPMTGGYLQPLTVPGDEVWKLAQLRPGESIRWEIGEP